MLFPGGPGCRALSLKSWQRGAGGWQRLLLAEKRPAAAPKSSHPLAASWRVRRPVVVWPGSFGPRLWMGKIKQTPFGHAEPLCYFSTPSHCEDSEYGRLIYRGSLATVVAGVKFFSYSTSLLTISVMYSVGFANLVHTYSFPLQIAFYSMMGLCTFITPVALHLLSRGYVIRLYYKAETDIYTAFTYNVILAEKKTVFCQKDVKVPNVSKIFTTFYAKKRSMLVNPLLFEYPHDYSHLMGYDKPFEFDCENPETSSENK